MVDMAVHLKTGGVLSASDYPDQDHVRAEGRQRQRHRAAADGTAARLALQGRGLPGPWAVVVDGNDNVWVSNFAMPASPIVQLCGVRTEHRPPGFKTGE